MEYPKLPSKRSTTGTPATMPSSTKKSKAEFKRESAARAKAWAEERKRKNERLGGADNAEETKRAKLSGDNRDEDSAADERGDVLENLPSTSPNARAARQSARLPHDSDGHDDSSLMSESSRSSRVLRRRTMDVAVTTTAGIELKNLASTPVGKRGRRARNSVGPCVAATSTMSEGAKETMSDYKLEEKESKPLKPRRSRKSETPQKLRALQTTPARTKSAIADKNPYEYVERQWNNKVVVVKETGHENVRIENHGRVESAEQLPVEVKENTGKRFKAILHSILPQVVVFTHALLLQWTIAFSIIVIFFPDWFIFQFCFDGACLGILSNGTGFMNDYDRAGCVTFGICLVIIAGNSIVHGSFSTIGWVSTTFGLAMASFSTKVDWWGISDEMILTVPSIPVYSNLNIPDLLVMIGLIGTVAALNQVGGDAEQIEPEVAGSLPNVPPENAAMKDGDDKEEQSDLGNGEKAARKCIGLRIAVEKKGVVFLGAVTDYDHSNRVWCVEYDSNEQDEEFLNRIQLASAIKEHSKEWTNYLKAIWLDGSI